MILYELTQANDSQRVKRTQLATRESFSYRKLNSVLDGVQKLILRTSSYSS